MFLLDEKMSGIGFEFRDLWFNLPMLSEKVYRLGFELGIFGLRFVQHSSVGP